MVSWHRRVRRRLFSSVVEAQKYFEMIYKLWLLFVGALGIQKMLSALYKWSELR
jgi:hypothetical protein